MSVSKLLSAAQNAAQSVPRPTTLGIVLTYAHTFTGKFYLIHRKLLYFRGKTLKKGLTPKPKIHSIRIAR